MFIAIAKWWYTMRQKPYFVTTFKNNKNGGGIIVTSEFNQFFIHELDQTYAANSTGTYKPAAPDNEKIALHLFDVMSSIADEYLPDELPPFLEDDSDIPLLGVRGGVENKTVVDLGQGLNKGGNVDFEGG